MTVLPPKTITNATDRADAVLQMLVLQKEFSLPEAKVPTSLIHRMRHFFYPNSDREFDENPLSF